MSRIDELIQEYCPEGVEYRLLGEVEDAGLIKLGRGSVISKKDIAAQPGDYPIYSSSASGVGEFGRYSKYMFDDERLSWSVDGGGKFFHRHAHKYSVTNVSGWLKVLKPSRIDVKFLYYVLDSAWTTKNFDYIKKAHPSVIRNEYKIPIPPLEVQNEIVRILDKFTQLEKDLSADLSAELVARQKQYEYYRKQLLTFDETRVNVRRITLGDIGKVSMCKRIFKDQTASVGDIPFYKIGTFGKTPNSFISQKIYDEYRSKYSFPKKGDVLLSASGTIGRRVVYDGEDAYFQDSNIIWLDNDENIVTNKYLFHIYKIVTWQTEGGTIQRLYNDNLKKIKIAVPPIDEQYRIVSILDKFEIKLNNISLSLPAEINARRQQYEYYRTKLLTFQEMSA